MPCVSPLYETYLVVIWVEKTQYFVFCSLTTQNVVVLLNLEHHNSVGMFLHVYNCDLFINDLVRVLIWARLLKLITSVKRFPQK